MLNTITVQFERVVYDKHDIVVKYGFMSINYFLELVIIMCYRLKFVNASVIGNADFQKGILLLSEVLNQVEKSGLPLKNRHKLEGLRCEFIRMHRVLDYCVLLEETSAEEFTANERLNQIREGIRTLIYQREFYGLDKDREVGKLFDEFFSLKPKKGLYSCDHPRFNDLKYVDFLFVWRSHSWRVCQDGHFYAADENADKCPEC